jgi:non-specific serine/threonine protein kinase
VLGRRIVVIGGFLANGASSARVDAYAPRTDRWSRLPNLPLQVNHAMAAASGDRLYVLGGHTEHGPSRSAFVLENRTWRRLPRMPGPRAAAGAGIVDGILYVVGGVGPNGLATRAFAFELARKRWSIVPGPTPREHLGVTAFRGRVYAVAGRTAGFDTNLSLVEVFDPETRRWRRLRRGVPEPRGGTGATALNGRLVSVGGEAVNGTIASVYAFNLSTRRWQRLPDLPTPRHGLGVVAFQGRVYAIAGGEQPGLFVSGVNESLRVP